MNIKTEVSEREGGQRGITKRKGLVSSLFLFLSFNKPGFEQISIFATKQFPSTKIKFGIKLMLENAAGN